MDSSSAVSTIATAFSSEAVAPTDIATIIASTLSEASRATEATDDEALKEQQKAQLKRMAKRAGRWARTADNEHTRLVQNARGDADRLIVKLDDNPTDNATIERGKDTVIAEYTLALRAALEGYVAEVIKVGENGEAVNTSKAQRTYDAARDRALQRMFTKMCSLGKSALKWQRADRRQ